jgi:hypothetical protein
MYFLYGQIRTRPLNFLNVVTDKQEIHLCSKLNNHEVLYGTLALYCYHIYYIYIYISVGGVKLVHIC